METMRAHVMEQQGGPEVLVQKRVAQPVASEGELLVRVAAAGLNPVDWKTRAGRGIAAWVKAPLPWILGWDFAGTVAAMGAGAAGFVEGDAVYGLMQLPGEAQGTYAEYVRVPAKDAARAPKALSRAEAAAVPLAALTAWQAIELVKVKRGERVLVHGASGGVGHFAVQLARDAGAHVIAVTSTPHAGFVRELGAHEIVDRTKTSFEDAIRAGVDVVLDTLGGETLTRTLAVLSEKSRIVTLPSPSPEHTHGGAQIPWFLVQPDAAALTEIARRIDAGSLRVHVEKTFDSAADAHAYAESNPVRGKLVLAM